MLHAVAVLVAKDADFCPQSGRSRVKPGMLLADELSLSKCALLKFQPPPCSQRSKIAGVRGHLPPSHDKLNNLLFNTSCHLLSVCITVLDDDCFSFKTLLHNVGVQHQNHDVWKALYRLH